MESNLIDKIIKIYEIQLSKGKIYPVSDSFIQRFDKMIVNVTTDLNSLYTE